MSVFKLCPVFKDYIWGGTRLRDEFGKKCSFDRVAESWELACRSDGCCTICGGRYDGKTLDELIRLDGKEILGQRCKDGNFPLLVKLIDAHDDLSVQVHPDDRYALEHEGDQGKTEMWYVLGCEKDAGIICGFDSELTKSELVSAIQQGGLLDRVRRFRVRKGDAFFIPSGTLHAICKGTLVVEIQQNSNTTYRVFDYNRLGRDGKPRELHTDKAVEVISTEPAEPLINCEAVSCGSFGYTVLVTCRYFTAVKFDTQDKVTLHIDGQSFAHLLILEGSCSAQGVQAQKGDSLFITAASGTVAIHGRCSFILTRTGCEEGIDSLVEK